MVRSLDHLSGHRRKGSKDLSSAPNILSASGRERNSAPHNPASALERISDYLLVTWTPAPTVFWVCSFDDMEMKRDSATARYTPHLECQIGTRINVGCRVLQGAWPLCLTNDTAFGRKMGYPVTVLRSAGGDFLRLCESNPPPGRPRQPMRSR